MSRNSRAITVSPGNPHKYGWCMTRNGTVRTDWKKKCVTPVIFLDIDGVLNSGNWAQWLANNPNPALHNWCDVNSVKELKEFLDSRGFMVVMASSWRKTNIFDTLERLDEIPGFKPLYPYIIGQTCRLNKDRTGGKNWCRGDEIKCWIDEFEPTWYGIIDDDKDMLPEQMKHFYQTDSEVGLHIPQLQSFYCKFKSCHKKGWKEKYDFSFGPRTLTYNFTTKKYE